LREVLKVTATKNKTMLALLTFSMKSFL